MGIDSALRRTRVFFASADSSKHEEATIRKALDDKIPLTRTYLSEQLFISERQLLRKLKSLTGLTPSQYILEVKLQKSRVLLENKTYNSVQEIAQACGFKNANYLAKVYFKAFGKKPNEYLHF